MSSWGQIGEIGNRPSLTHQYHAPSHADHPLGRDPVRERFLRPDCCVRVYRADPSAADAPREIGRFAEAGFGGNREGIAIAGDFVIVTNQLRQRSQYHVYRRDGWQEVEIWRGMADMTDGIEAAARPMRASFPKGILVAMNSRRHNFHLYSLY